MLESLRYNLPLIVFAGLCLAAWAQVSLMREMEARIRRCANCPTCKFREQEENAKSKEKPGPN